MNNTTPQQYDILIAGSGFGGSITALMLDKCGFKVCLVEKGRHPRFAIGESSTPVADLMLRRIAAEYDLPWLQDFSRYGSWQQSHPEVVCGIKRGFSFFKQYPGKPFTTDANHTNELLVAASTDDIQSDTNWLRADFDAFLVERVKETGVTYLDQTEIVFAGRNSDWTFQLDSQGQTSTIQAGFFIDATGGGYLLEKLFDVKSTSDDFLTNSFAVFSHFNDVPRWTAQLQQWGFPTEDFPYDPDNSALHQVLDEGWMWMLRFNDRRTSLGFVLDGHKENPGPMTPAEQWGYFLERYPALNEVLKDLELSAQPGAILRSGRLQRQTLKAFGPGWVALPHTVGFVDPLFSSGIAHSLTGIIKVVNLIKANGLQSDSLQEQLQSYEHAVFAELRLIDKLIAGCFKAMPHFGLFNTWSALYFAATIANEQKLIKKEKPGYFLGADNPYITDMVDELYPILSSLTDKESTTDEEIREFTALVRERIAPVNIAGLLNDDARNMYKHTVAVF